MSNYHIDLDSELVGNEIQNINHKSYINGNIRHGFDFFEHGIIEKLATDEANSFLTKKVKNEAYNKSVVAVIPVYDNLSYIDPINSDFEYRIDLLAITTVDEFGIGGLGAFTLQAFDQGQTTQDDFLKGNSVIITKTINNDKHIYGVLNMNSVNLMVDDPAKLEVNYKEINNKIIEVRKTGKPILLEYTSVSYKPIENLIVLELSPLYKKSSNEPLTIDMNSTYKPGNYSLELYMEKIVSNYNDIKDNSMVKMICDYCRIGSSNGNDWKDIKDLLLEENEINIELDIYNKRYRLVEETYGIKLNPFELLNILNQNNVSLYNISVSDVKIEKLD